MDEIPAFEKPVESDIKTLAAEIQNNREKPLVQNYSERELVKEAIRAFPKLEKRSAASAVPQPASASTPQVPAAGSRVAPAASHLPDYAQNAAPEVKLEIEHLLDIALHQGISRALAASEDSPYFVQDAFHDALAGKLYPELQKRGIVK